ncbi:hypothetical protein G9U53_17665 [Rhodococcus sp. D-46]|uniref:hypothetical protein n=1 Tax=Rhodococcus sp. D-46 TaxID=2716265 RepID=UPI0013F5A4F9|nr:hypothetical protein [Rhodococcus sp. D-46]
MAILQMAATGAGHNGHGDESEKHCCRMASDATLHLVRGGTRVGGELFVRDVRDSSDFGSVEPDAFRRFECQSAAAMLLPNIA